jgi:serpin B
MTRRLLLVSALLCAALPGLVALSGCSVPPANATVLVQPGTPDSAAAPAQPEDRFVGAINDFGIDLLGSLATSKKANAIISPVSIHAALSMTANGATDETAKQMRGVLHTGDIPVDEANAQWASLLKQLGDRGPEQTLEIANAMWGNKDVDFKKPFIDADRTSFGAQLSVLDFLRDDVAGAINEWADVNTHGMIKKVVKEVPSEAILCLANAVYFKGDWNEPFEARSTQETPFVRAMAPRSTSR